MMNDCIFDRRIWKVLPELSYPFCAVLRIVPYIKNAYNLFIHETIRQTYDFLPSLHKKSYLIYYKSCPKEPDNDAISKTAPRQVRRSVEPERDPEKFMYRYFEIEAAEAARKCDQTPAT